MNKLSKAKGIGVSAALASAVVATALTGGVVAAQTSTPAPVASPSTTTPSTGTTPAQPRGMQVGPGFGQGRNGQDGQDGHGGPGQGFDQGGQGFGQGMPGGMDRGGPGGIGQNSITIASIDGTTLGLVTADGWTRSIDTAGIVLTNDGATIPVTDLLVGQSVKVDETRNADGTYTVTGIETAPTRVSGTVGTVGTDSFTIVKSDGTSVTVSVSATTTFSAVGSTSAGSLSSLTAGQSVSAQGALQADGSIAATSVVTR